MLNVDGYYDPLLTLFDKGVQEGFIKPVARHIILSAPNPYELLTKMEVIFLKLCGSVSILEMHSPFFTGRTLKFYNDDCQKVV